MSNCSKGGHRWEIETMECPDRDLHWQCKLGPLHVHWQVSFGCWVTWSILSWQEYYKSVFFPKGKDEQQNFFYRLSTTEAWTFCKMNALNSLISSHQKNWANVYLIFNHANFGMIKSNCHVPNSFFWYTCKFYHSKIDVL